MTYHCQFCWTQVWPDGCGFTHYNPFCPYEQIEHRRPWWLSNKGVFDAKFADYMAPIYYNIISTPLKELEV